MSLHARPQLDAVPRRHIAVLVKVAALAVVPYAVGVLVPYFVNDLHRLPLSEVASGAHDPKDLWPQGPVAGLVQITGLFSLAVTPLVLGGVAAAGALALLPHRGRLPHGTALALVVVTAVCLVGVGFVLSPAGQGLATWILD